MAEQRTNSNEKNNLINGMYHEKTYYNKVFWSVPKSCVLIKENKLTGNAIVKGPGLRFNFPGVYRGLFLSTKEYNIDEPKVECIDSEGQKLYIDYEIKLRIVDPIEFLYNHKDPEDDLRDNIKEIVRVLAKSASWEELSKNRFGMSDCGRKIIKIGNPTFDYKLTKAVDFIEEYQEEYGLQLVSVVSKEVQQSEELQKAYDEKIRKDKEGEALIAQAKRNKEKAEIDAQTKRTEADAEAYRKQRNALVESQKIKLIIEAAKQGSEGLPEEQRMQIISNALQSYFLTNGENPNTNVFASTNSRDILKAALVNNLPTNTTDGSEVKRKTKSRKNS